MTTSRTLCVLAALLVVLFAASPLHAEDAPEGVIEAPVEAEAERPARAGLHVADWLVIFDTTAVNDPALATITARSTLPGNVNSGRPAAPSANIAQPIGVITFRSDDESLPDGFELRLGDADCSFMAVWPLTARTVAPVSWTKLKLSRDATVIRAVAADHWSRRLRSDDTLSITMGSTRDRLLLYDVAIKQASPLTISIDPASTELQVKSLGDVVREHIIITPVDGGWRVHTDNPADAKAPEAAATKVLSREEATENLRPFVAASGLPEAEVGNVLLVLRDMAMWRDHATVVARVEAGTMDAMVPLRVLGVKATHTRAGFIVAVARPIVATDKIDLLVKQLGSDLWREREGAELELQNVGEPARTALIAANSGKDVEVRHRAERIIANLNNDPGIVYPPESRHSDAASTR